MDELSGKRIFVIEDDPTNMAVFAATLKRSGALVMQDPWNGRTVKLLKQFLPVDIILIDLMLRFGVSGYEIFDKIKHEPELAAVPVVVVSASDPEVEIPRAMEKGFAGFIAKPIDSSQFPLQIACCMKGDQVWYSGEKLKVWKANNEPIRINH